MNKSKVISTIVTLVLTAGVASADAGHGELHAAKDCSAYTGLPGSSCTFTSSNLAEIPIGSKLFYDQAAGIPTGLLDSNVVLDAGGGNRTRGRCTLDFSTALGLCTFSDGTGDLTGFYARVTINCNPNPTQCSVDGTYSYIPITAHQ